MSKKEYLSKAESPRLKYLLLAIIYLTFVSLGLPDSVFGAAWPQAYVDMGVAQSMGSLYSVVTGITSGGTSFIAGKLIRRFGTGSVTAVSVGLTVAGLIGISFAPDFIVMMICAVVMGIGAGAIDTGLNNYVSRNYKAGHMNWLHCFWGVGVTASPIIMSLFLRDGDWRRGYLTIGLIQLAIAVAVAACLPLWKKLAPPALPEESAAKAPKKGFREIITTRGVIAGILSLGFYCSMEFIVGTWGASYLVNAGGNTPADASKFVSAFFGGIMFGRLVAGFAAFRLKDKSLIRIGTAAALPGMILLAVRAGTVTDVIGMLLIGVGFGPIFPSVIHSVPERFGAEYSADITGYHMGGAYAIAFAVQFAFGFVATDTTFAIMPYVLLAFLAFMAVACEIAVRLTAKPPVAESSCGAHEEDVASGKS